MCLRECVVMSDRPKANVYVDGFNVYRQKLRYPPDVKWLDLEALFSKLLSTHDIQRIRYFTALIQPLLGTDPQAPIRQQTYIRALQTQLEGDRPRGPVPPRSPLAAGHADYLRRKRGDYPGAGPEH